MTAYYHFACKHSAETIDRVGFLRPHPQPVLAGLPLVWLSILRHPQPMWLGMDQRHQRLIECDRMEFCYQVIPEDEHLVARWGDLKMIPQFEPYLAGARRLDAAHGVRPGLWAVSSNVLRVVRAP